MSELNAQFESAAEEVQNLSERPSNEDLLKLYALFKQGSVGDVSGKRPGMLDLKGRAKYDAWAELEGTSAEDAKQQYVDLVKELKKKFG